MLRASIVVIGDELLGGFVQDTNSHLLATRLHAHAVPLDRVHVVPDTHAAIDEALQAELGRARPRLVMTTGGIGSTPDDITFEAIASSLGQDLIEHPDLVARLDGSLTWTAEQGVDVDEEFRHHFLRMARVPAAATLLPGAGWAPALRIDVDGGVDVEGGATIAVLPGVPGQTRGIVRDGLEPTLLAGRNPAWATVEVPHGYPESMLNPMFARLGREHPEVQLGSYPGVPMLVRLKGRPAAVERAAVFVRGEIAELDASSVGRRLRAAWAERIGGLADDAAAAPDEHDDDHDHDHEDR